MKHVLIFIPLLAFSSCATVTRGIHEKLRVVSEPAQAHVQLSTGETGTTPATFVKNRRSEPFTVTVSKSGYASQTVNVESKFSGTGGAAMAGNALVGGLIGIGVDAASGAYNSLYPNPVSVRLIPKKRSESSGERAPKRMSGATSNSQSSSRPQTTPPPESSASHR